MQRHRWVLMAYAALSIVLTWPLILHFGTHVPGDGIDDPSLAWNLWWVKYALVDQPQNPFFCAWQFWPIGINLAFYTLTLLNGMLSIPLQPLPGLIPAYNLLLLSSFVLGGYGAFLLARDFLHSVQADPRPGRHAQRGRAPFPWAAFVAGLLYAFSSAKLFYASLGQGNIASSQWVPFALLYIVRASRPAARTRDAVLAGLFIVLQAYAELTFATFLLIFAAMAWLWGLAHGFVERRRLEPGRVADHLKDLSPLVLRGALVALLLLAGLTPFLAAMLPDLQAEGDLFTSGGGFANLFSADLAGYLLPTQLHPLLGDLTRAVTNHSLPRPDASHFPVDKGQQIFVGYAALGLAGLGFLTGRCSARTWFWALAAALFFALTLGPSLRVGGYDLGVPMPFTLVAQLPFFEGNRYPSRYSVMLLACLAPLVALGAARLAEWSARFAARRAAAAHLAGAAADVIAAGRLPRFVMLMVSGLILFEHLSIPLPLSDLQTPGLYQRLADEPGDFAVLELPIGWRNGARVVGKRDTVIMQQLWYQNTHGKRLLGGNTSRNPEIKFQYFSESPTLARLIAAVNAADTPQHDALRSALAAAPVSGAEREQARAWAAFLNLRYVMVHRDKLAASHAEDLLRELLPVQLAGEEGALALYRLESEAAPHEIALAGAEGRLALAEGWGPPGNPGSSLTAGCAPGPASGAVWAQRTQVRLLLPLSAEPVQIRFYGWSPVPEQVVTLLVNGKAMGERPLGQTPGWLTFDVPAGVRPSALSDVNLRFRALLPTGDLDCSAAGAASPAGGVLILARSAGEETGDFAHVYVDGTDWSLGSRGYNLVAVDPQSGRVIAPAAFDTHASPAANQELAEWLGALPAGTIVAGAVRDEASLALDAEAVAALQTLGVTGDLRGRFRWGHAFVGVKDASAGSAVESTGAVLPVQAQIGIAVSAPMVAGAFVTVSITGQ